MPDAGRFHGTHTPNAILQTAFSFWSSQVLLTAVEFGVFTRLADRNDFTSLDEVAPRFRACLE